MTEIIRTKTENMLKNYCCPELKAAAEAFLKADGTADEAASLAGLKKVLPESIASIDDAMEFAKSDYCREKYGAEAAANILKETEAQKARGEKYCGCGGCQAALDLLNSL